MNCNQFYTLDETAALLACSTKHVQRMVARGDIHAIDIGIGRKKLRIAQSEIDSFAMRRTVATDQPRRKAYTPKNL